jgi:hypothetical protein
VRFQTVHRNVVFFAANVEGEKLFCTFNYGVGARVEWLQGRYRASPPHVDVGTGLKGCCRLAGCFCKRERPCGRWGCSTPELIHELLSRRFL